MRKSGLTRMPIVKTDPQSSTSLCPPLTRPHSLPVHPLAQLQQTIGNQAVQRMLRAHVIQTKLTMNQPGDEYEQEADRVADLVTRMELPVAASHSGDRPRQDLPLQRKCAECEEEEKIQRKSDDGETQAAPPIVDEVLSSAGQPLDETTRAFFEPRLGHEFGRVRVHTDARAAESARAVNAMAYTAGEHIVFAEGQYAPHATGGRALLAHEMVHVMQQRAGLQRKAPDRQTRPISQPAGTDDFAEAQGYINSYYLVQTNIITDVYLGANNAVHKFGIYSGVTEKEGTEPPIATIKAVLGLIPDAGPILEVLEMLEKNMSIAKEVVGLVRKPEEKPDSREETGKALDKTITPYRQEKQVALEQQQKDLDYLASLHKDPSYKGKLLSTVVNRLGQKPRYDAEVMRKLELEYELQLYKEFYLQVAWINHMPPSMIGVPFTRYVIHEVPEAAQKRILELFNELGHTTKVSIDTRFSENGKHPEYAEVVKILLDWGVKLYWLRGYVSDKPEELHTGTDLQQPYRGEKFKEVK